MTTMISEVYEAFKEANVSDASARKASESPRRQASISSLSDSPFANFSCPVFSSTIRRINALPLR